MKGAMKTFLLCLVLAVPPAQAAPAATPSTVEKARAAFLSAQQLYQASRFVEALKKFEEAQALNAHPVILFNIARCHEQLGAVPEAIRAYREYLRLSPGAADRSEVQASIASLEKRAPQSATQTLVVSAEPAGSLVKVDGKSVGKSPVSTELPPGEHELEVSAEGFEPFKRTFTLTALRPLEMNVSLRAVTVAADAPTRPPTLTPDDAPPMPPLVSQPVEPRRRTFTWVAGGAALVSGAVATGLGIGANATAAELRSGTVRPTLEGDAIAGRAQGLATGANVAWAVAGTAAVTAIVLFFVEGS